MSTGRRTEIERCLSQELHIERDHNGRVVLARAGTGSLEVDWQAGVARFSNEFTSSSWSDSVASYDTSYGTWEKSTSEPASIESFVGWAMQCLRGELMSIAVADVKQLCRQWFSYGIEHNLAVGSMRKEILEFYLSTTSLDDPQELVTLARAVDRISRPELWDKILKRIDCFSPKKKRLIRQELGLETKKPGKTKNT